MSNQPLHTTHLAPSQEPFAGKLIPSLNLKHATANVYRNFEKICKYHIFILYGLNQTSELPSFVCGTAKLEPVQVSNLPNSSNLSFEIRLFFGTSELMKTWKMQLVIIKLLHCQPHEGSCRISKSSEPRGLQLLDVKTSPASD